MKLGQLLLHRGLIDREQLRVALRRQATTGRPLGEILLSMGIVSRAAILGALRKQPHASVSGDLLRQVPSDIRDLIPTSVAQRLVALPVDVADDVLVVAMADPTDRSALEALRAASGFEVVGVISDPQALAEAIAEETASVAGQPTGTDAA